MTYTPTRRKATLSHSDNDDDLPILPPPTLKSFDYDKFPIKFHIISPLGDEFDVTCHKLHVDHDVHQHLARLVKQHGRVEGQARLLSHYLLDWFERMGNVE